MGIYLHTKEIIMKTHQMTSYTFHVPSPVNARQRIDVVDGQIIATWSNPDNSLTRIDHDNPIPFNPADYDGMDLRQI